MIFAPTYARFSVEGLMPERALLRLKRAGIDLFNVKKTQKNQILLSVKKKDVQKVFAIYPKVCYNINAYSPYAVRFLGETGVGKTLAWLKKRIGFVLGALLFCAFSLFADSLVLGIDFVGSSVYAREVRIALEEYGVTPFASYKRGNEDLVCAKLLSLRGVEFCSVQKKGLRVLVEIRLTDLPEKGLLKGDMQAKRTGELLSLTALRGTPLKKAGERVTAGEPIVGSWFEINDGGRMSVEVIARASIACVFEEEIQAESEENAFATAYLKLDLSAADKITGKSVEKTEQGYLVRIAYVAIENLNL